MNKINWKEHKYGNGEFLYLSDGLIISYSLDLIEQNKYVPVVFGKKLKKVDSVEKAKEMCLSIAKSRLKRANIILKELESVKEK